MKYKTPQPTNDGIVSESYVGSINLKTYTLQIPVADKAFFSALVKKMGWISKAVSSKKQDKSQLDLAIEDINKGNLKSFDNIDALMSYLND